MRQNELRRVMSALGKRSRRSRRRAKNISKTMSDLAKRRWHGVVKAA